MRDWDQFVFKSRGKSGNGSALCGYAKEAGQIFIGVSLAATALLGIPLSRS